MDETTDDKIERLVHSVLAAVDARLGAVRDEVHALAADVEARHREVTTMIGELERRLARQAVVEQPAAADTRRMEQATQMLLERIEAMHQRTTIATNERFAQINAALDELRGGPAMPSTPRDLSAVNAPLIAAPLMPTSPLMPTTPVPAAAHVTGQVPTTIVAPAPTVAPAAAATPSAGTDAIDLDRLGDLLSERLGKLHLGTPTDPSAR